MFIDSIALNRFQRLRIYAFRATIVLFCAVILFFRSVWEDYGQSALDIEQMIAVAGLGFIGIAILGRMWCTLYIGGRKASALVEHGPYSVTRNPLYVFSTIGAAGVGAQTGSIFMALICAVIAYSLFRITIRREEAYLAETFGASYDAYRARVPAFLPRFGRFRDLKTIEVLPRRLYRTLGDGMIFFLAMPVFELIEVVQDIGWVPIVLRLA